MEIQEKICKLCLEKCKNYKAIDENTIKYFNILLPNIDFTGIRGLVMCGNCADMLRKCFDFKSTCLHTRDYMVSFVNKDNVKLDIRDIYASRNVNSTGDADDQDICGYCLNLIKHCSFVSLDDGRNDFMLKEMIEQCLPELDLSIIKKPVICLPCRGSLEVYFRLVTNCLILEEKIKKYRENLNINDESKIDLSSFLEFTTKFVTKNEANDNLVDAIKVEQFCEARENPDECKVENKCDIIMSEQMCFDNRESVNGDIEDRNESFTEMNENMLTCKEDSHKLEVIKIEELEIKVEEHDFKSTVLPQPEPTIRLCLTSKPNIKSTSTGECAAKTTKKYSCGLCSYQTNNKRCLKGHLLEHKDPLDATMYKCGYCSYQTKMKRYLKCHLLNHKKSLDATVYKCDSCCYQTLKKRYLRRHLLVHRNPSEVTMYKCYSCSYQSKYKYFLKCHLLKHRDSLDVTVYKCGSCSYQTIQKDYFRKHLLVHKNSSERAVYRCDSCSFQSNYKVHLRKHLMVHKDPSEITMYKCDTCLFETKYKDNLKTHLLLHKDSLEIRMYKCGFCPYQTKYNSGLGKHMLLHMDPAKITMYKCDSCSHQTKYKKDLQRHFLVHKDPSEVTMYKCESCSYQTKNKYYIKQHLLKHKDPSERTMYRCDHCAYQTMGKYQLRQHLLLHRDPSDVLV